MSRRRSLLVLVLTMAVVAWLTRETFAAVNGSSRQELLSFALAGALVAGTYLSGGWPPAARGRRKVVGPVVVGLVLALAFWVLGGLTSWIGPLGNGAEEMERNARALSGLGLLALVLAGAAEELFYRGALFERVRLPVLTTALAHLATTLLTGNVALTLSAGFLGVVLGLTRRTSGGWWAPAVSHVVWSLAMVRWVA